MQDTRPETLTAAFEADLEFVQGSYVRWARVHPRIRKHQVIRAILSVAVMTFVVTEYGNHLLPFAAAGLGLMLWSVARLPERYARMAVRQLRPTETPGVLGARTVTVSPAALTEITGARRSEWQLGRAAKLHVFDDLAVISPAPGTMVPVPRTADFGPDTFESFCIKLRVMIDSVKAGKPEA